jgi:large subunit ribosomal protein L4
MPTVDVINISGEKVGEVELPDDIYGVELRPHLVHEVVTAQLHSRRAGTACTKTRGEVNYSTRKPYSQKKTGRARAGTRRSPIWRGGGTIFGPKPRDFSWRPPTRVRREALRIVLTAKLKENQLTVVDGWPLEAIKTKAVVEGAKNLGLGADRALVVLPGRDRVLELSSRNVPSLDVIMVEGLNCYDILRHERLVILKDGLALIEERLSRRGTSPASCARAWSPRRARRPRTP